MQYLKDEVRNNIITNALCEFKEKGYANASIRSIAKKSNSSVGNIYKYFENKESLYENIIGSVYHKVMGYIDMIKEAVQEMKSEDVLLNLVNNIVELFQENRTALAILFNKSEGSMYENCKSTLEETVTKLAISGIEYKLSQNGKKLKDSFIISLMSHSFVESISIILKQIEDGREVRKYILDLIDIFFNNLWSKLDTEDI